MRDPRMLLGCVSALVVVLGFRVALAAQPDGAADRELRISRLLVGDRVPRVLRALGEILVHLSVSRHPRSSERSSGSRGSADPVWIARQAMADVRPVRADRHRDLEDDRISVVEPRCIAVRRRSQFKLPPLEPNAMVLFLDPQPYSYLVPSMPNSARAIGVNNNLVHPGGPGGSGASSRRLFGTTKDHCGASKIPTIPRAWPTPRWAVSGWLATANALR